MTAVPKPQPALVIPEYRVYISGLPCLICLPGDQTTRTEVCHVHTRRNAGDAQNLVPMCSKHHAEQHFTGIRSFEQRHVKDLEFEARQVWARWQRGDFPRCGDSDCPRCGIKSCYDCSP